MLVQVHCAYVYWYEPCLNGGVDTTVCRSVLDAAWFGSLTGKAVADRFVEADLTEKPVSYEQLDP